MPQMFQYCGKRFKVFRRAHKTCDTVNPVASRRIAAAVHLNLRCDGKAYSGCQAACLIFWKEAWLKVANENAAIDQPTASKGHPDQTSTKPAICTEDDVWRGTCVQPDKPGEEVRYTCQATQLPYYTTPLSWWDARQYAEDYFSGNVTLGEILRGFIYLSYYHLALAKRNRLGRPARWLYDQFQKLIGGIPYPRRTGSIPAGQPTPVADLNLQPGEMVRVKSYKEILATLDVTCRNRNMFFDAELVPYCGGVYRVRARVTKFINEKTGRLSTMKTPAVILEGAWCHSRYSNCRMFCPRAIYAWWREIWLERTSETTTTISEV